MRYEYEAYEGSGERKTGVVEAASEAEAREELIGKGLFISRLHRVGHGGGDRARAHRRAGGKRLETVVQFTRELSVLAATGTPIADALSALERQVKEEKFNAVVRDLRKRVEEGASLSSAMGEHREYFDPVCQSLTSAGEESGELDGMLARLADIMRQQLVIRRAVLGAITYPAVLISLSLVAVIVILLVVVPRFAQMFESLHTPLPPTTELLLFIAETLRAYWIFLAVGLGGSVAAIWIAMTRPSGRQWLDAALVNAPVAGPAIRRIATARIARLLGSLLGAHLTLIEALELTAGAITNTRFKRVVERSSEMVTEGDSLARAFDQGGVMTPAFVEAVRNGEATGRLGSVLTALSDHLDEDNREAMRSLTKSIEPIMVGTLGIVIAFLALSLFTPLFDLTSATSPAQGGGG